MFFLRFFVPLRSFFPCHLCHRLSLFSPFPLSHKMTTRSHKASASTSGLLSVRPLDPKKLEPFQNGAAPPPPYVVRSKRPSDSSSVTLPVPQPTQSTMQRQSRSTAELTTKPPAEPPAKPAEKTAEKTAEKPAEKPATKPVVVVGTPPAKTLSPLSKPPSPPKVSGSGKAAQTQTLLNGHYVCIDLTHQHFCIFRLSDSARTGTNRKSWSRWAQVPTV